MNLPQQPKICTECNGLCRPLVCKAKLESSEWYCEKCHKSYPVFEKGKQ